MVRAILEGRKTQTRRVIKTQPQESYSQGYTNGEPDPAKRFSYGWSWQKDWWCSHVDVRSPNMSELCPYGKAGDRLWVRETFCVGYEYERGKFTALPFDGCENVRRAFYRATDNDAPDEPKRPWKPSIHMPRWASRITLEIVNVRVERVQDITFSDVLDEGIAYRGHGDLDVEANCYDDFVKLWNSITHTHGYGWNANPWVWVVKFNRVQS